LFRKFSPAGNPFKFCLPYQPGSLFAGSAKKQHFTGGALLLHGILNYIDERYIECSHIPQPMDHDSGPFTHQLGSLYDLASAPKKYS
jgi:hypothetical protein